MRFSSVIVSRTQRAAALLSYFLILGFGAAGAALAETDLASNAYALQGDASKISPLKNVDKAKAATLQPQELGPAIGEGLPHDLIDVNNNGGVDTLMGENGLAIFFVRSLDWCPYCKNQALEVNERRAEFEVRGLNVVFISYDDAEKQTRFADDENVELALLSDTDIEIINAFGLRNEKYKPSSRAYGIPYPAVFIVDSDKMIAAKLYEEDYKSNSKSYRDRPAVDLILDKVDEVIE